MRETLRSPGVEQRPPFLIRNVLVAHAIAFATDKILREGLSPDGRKLLKQFVVKAWMGTKVSIAKDISRLNQESSLDIEVKGQEYIPSSGPTIFVANHTHGGPLNNIGQFFEMVKEGENARFNVDNDQVREPFIIVQRGLGKARLMRLLSGVFYDIVAENSFGCEIVAIPKHNDSGEIINGQNLRPAAIERIIDGGASLWLPQGREREPDDFRFPEKATGFLKRINERDGFTQLVPIRSIPDQQGNIKIVFGTPVDINHVVANGGINYFAQNHIAPLK